MPAPKDRRLAIVEEKYPELYADALRLDAMDYWKLIETKGLFDLSKLERRFRLEDAQLNLF